jgi:hypothetical protein
VSENITEVIKHSADEKCANPHLECSKVTGDLLRLATCCVVTALNC